MRAPDKTEALLTLSQGGKLEELRQAAAPHGYDRAIGNARRCYRRSGGARRRGLHYLLRHLVLAAEATEGWPARETLSPHARAERDHMVRADAWCAVHDTAARTSRRIRPAMVRVAMVVRTDLPLHLLSWIVTPVVTVLDRVSWLKQGDYRGEFYAWNDDRSW